MIDFIMNFIHFKGCNTILPYRSAKAEKVVFFNKIVEDFFIISRAFGINDFNGL